MLVPWNGIPCHLSGSSPGRDAIDGKSPSIPECLATSPLGWCVPSKPFLQLDFRIFDGHNGDRSVILPTGMQSRE